MKILMRPHLDAIDTDNGIGQVLLNYHRWFPKVNIQLVEHNYNLIAAHGGVGEVCDVHHNHGFWFNSNLPEHKLYNNQAIIKQIIHSKAVTVPSNYVAETFKRDFKIKPHVIGHGVNFEEWQGGANKNYILWNKNRTSKVCDPSIIYELAASNKNLNFVTTFVPYGKIALDNLRVTGKIPFMYMKDIIKDSSVYLSTAKETFGIGILEALAAGVPVLAFAHGSVTDIVKHKVNGYLVKPGDKNELQAGLEWLTKNRDQLTDSCKATAEKYTWLEVIKQIKNVYEEILESKKD